jgi:poly-gamma-glutamate capsule biosynthesis protein CapA/YwtB (metallophosphatase superfamily)
MRESERLEGWLNLLLSGDAMLGRGVNVVLHRTGPGYPLEPLATLTRAADLFFTNLECAISPRNKIYSGPSKMFYFRADPVAAEALAYAGVDLVSLANNHALDADFIGLLDTLAILDEIGIRHVGAGLDLMEASRPVQFDVKGMKIGVLAYCDHQPDFAAGENRSGIRYIDLSNPETPGVLSSEVAALASRVDHVVVAFHWQPNWVPYVPPFYRSLARDLVSSGARLIWGHSPHHFQGVEWIDQSLVIYSSGGLVDDYALEPNFRNDRQLLFQVTLGAPGIEQARAFPIELEYARTYPAGTEARRWIVRYFQQMCAEVGSRVAEDGEWLEILPVENALSDDRKQKTA